MTTVTRRYRFSASHRLHTAELTAEENIRVFGKCNHAFGHGHDYVLEVTVSGAVDSLTGRIVRVDDLDRLVSEKVLQVVANRYLNADLEEFATLTATTENVAKMITRLLEENWSRYIDAPSAALWRVHLQETDRNRVEIAC